MIATVVRHATGIIVQGKTKTIFPPSPYMTWQCGADCLVEFTTREHTHLDPACVRKTGG